MAGVTEAISPSPPRIASRSIAEPREARSRKPPKRFPFAQHRSWVLPATTTLTPVLLTAGSLSGPLPVVCLFLALPPRTAHSGHGPKARSRLSTTTAKNLRLARFAHAALGLTMKLRFNHEDRIPQLVVFARGTLSQYTGLMSRAKNCEARIAHGRVKLQSAFGRGAIRNRFERNRAALHWGVRRLL